jgi:hypothetical protein
VEKRNRGTRRDLKPSDIKRATDQPIADNKTNASGDPTTEPFGYIYTGSHSITVSKWKQKEKEGQEQRDGGQQAAENRNRIMRPFVAFWQVFAWRKIPQVVQKIDRHHGSITAVAAIFTMVATGAIVKLTSSYATYSKNQWQTMQDGNRLTRDTSTLASEPTFLLAEKMA